MNRRIKHNNMDDFFNTLYNSSFETAKQMLYHSKNATIRNCAGNTPIHWAILKNDIEKLQQFIKLNCDLNSVNKNAEKPIYLAVKQHYLKAVVELVSAGVDLESECTSQTSYGGYFTPLQLAVVIQDQEIVRYLASNSDGLKSQPLLQLAIKNQDMSMLTLLLELGTNLDVVDRRGHTALTRALVRSNTEFLKTILKYGPNLEQCICMTSPSAIELTPLLYTLVSSRLGVLKILLDAGANLECNQATKTLLFKTRGFRCFSPICFVVSTSSSLDSNFWPLECLIEANCALIWPCGKHSLEGSDSESLNYMHDSAFFMALKHQRYKAALLLLHTGFDLTRVSWPTKGIVKHMRNHIENSGYELQFKYFFSNPHPLDVLCRNVIREILGQRLSEKITELPFPQKIKDFILLKGLCTREIM